MPLALALLLAAAPSRSAQAVSLGLATGWSPNTTTPASQKTADQSSRKGPRVGLVASWPLGGLARIETKARFGPRAGDNGLFLEGMVVLGRSAYEPEDPSLYLAGGVGFANVGAFSGTSVAAETGVDYTVTNAITGRAGLRFERGVADDRDPYSSIEFAAVFLFGGVRAFEPADPPGTDEPPRWPGSSVLPFAPAGPPAPPAPPAPSVSLRTPLLLAPTSLGSPGGSAASLLLR